MPSTDQAGQGPRGQDETRQGQPGLPPAAQARLAELRQTRSWGSSLEVSEFAAISKVGFQPVGQVLGAAVYNIGDPGDEECPYGVAVYRGEGYRPYGPSAGGMRLGPGPVQPPVGVAAIGSARPLVSVLYQARRAAISRMTAECAALGGLGVIGVTLSIGPFGDDESILEFRAFGTAVRAPGVVSRAQPFASDLSGQDFTKLVAHGYVPVGLALGVAVGYRHDDWLTKGQTRLSAGNVEVVGYSELVRQMLPGRRRTSSLMPPTPAPCTWRDWLWRGPGVWMPLAERCRRVTQWRPARSLQRTRTGSGPPTCGRPKVSAAVTGFPPSCSTSTSACAANRVRLRRAQRAAVMAPRGRCARWAPSRQGSPTPAARVPEAAGGRRACECRRWAVVPSGRTE